jgi:hypothetical protein
MVACVLDAKKFKLGCHIRSKSLNLITPFEFMAKFSFKFSVFFEQLGY